MSNINMITSPTVRAMFTTYRDELTTLALGLLAANGGDVARALLAKHSDQLSLSVALCDHLGLTISPTYARIGSVQGLHIDASMWGHAVTDCTGAHVGWALPKLETFA